jgi:hypothetical protein
VNVEGVMEKERVREIGGVRGNVRVTVTEIEKGRI